MNQDYITLVDEIKTFMERADPCEKKNRKPCLNPPGCNCSGCSFLGPNYICQTKNLICAINFCNKAVANIQRKGKEEEYRALRRKYWAFMLQLFAELAGDASDSITIGTSWATLAIRPPGNTILS